MRLIRLARREIFREAVFLRTTPFEAALIYREVMTLRYCLASSFLFSAIRPSIFFILVLISDVIASLRLRFFTSDLNAL